MVGIKKVGESPSVKKEIGVNVEKNKKKGTTTFTFYESYTIPNQIKNLNEAKKYINFIDYKNKG